MLFINAYKSVDELINRSFFLKNFKFDKRLNIVKKTKKSIITLQIDWFLVKSIIFIALGFYLRLKLLVDAKSED